MSKAPPQAKAPEGASPAATATPAAIPTQGQAAPPERKIPDGPNSARMEQAEFKRNNWVVIAAPGTIPTDLMTPSYWAHLADKLKPWEKIEVRADDASWYCELLVVDVSRLWARVRPLLLLDLTTSDVSQSQANRENSAAEYEVLHRGEHCKWSVVRKKDLAVVHEFEETRIGAAQWLQDRLKAE